MNIRHNCLFFLAKEPGKSDARLKLRVRWNGQTVCFNPGYRINIKGWSTESQRCVSNTYHGVHKTPASKINREIQRYLDAVEDAFDFFEKQGKMPSREELRTKVEKSLGIGKDIPDHSETVSELIDRFVDSESVLSSWSKGTVTKVRTIQKQLNECMPSMNASEITNSALEKIVRWYVERGYRNATISKNIAVMRWFIRWAYRNGYYEGKAHETFTVKIHGYDKEVIYLSWEELMRICGLDLGEKTFLDNIRNVFCFCCFTSLRYSDVQKLTWDDVHENSISVVTKKTTDIIKIDLNKHSKALLDKYREMKYKGNKVFPVYANQVMNRGLKDLGRKAELNDKIRMVSYSGSKRIEEVFEKWQVLTTHCARRTFVVNAMFLGIPEDVIRSWTGHSDSESMKPYKKVVDELKRNEMDKFNRD